jgi:hypothetical protein
MQSMWICISCVTFAMEVLSLHPYPDQRQPYRHVLERVHYNLGQTGTLKTRALADRARRNVRDQEYMLDTVHDNPSTRTRRICSVTGRLSRRAASSIVRENKLYPFHAATTSARVAAGDKHLRLQQWSSTFLNQGSYFNHQQACGQHIGLRVLIVEQNKYIKTCLRATRIIQKATGRRALVYSFLDEFYARLCTILNFCAVARYEGKTLWHGSSGLRRHKQLTVADIVHGQPFFVRDSIWRHCEACVQAEGRHFENLLWLCTVHSVRWQSPPHEQEVFKREYSEVTKEKCYKGQNDVLSLQQGTQQIFYVKANCFHFVKLDSLNNKSDMDFTKS